MLRLECRLNLSFAAASSLRITDNELSPQLSGEFQAGFSFSSSPQCAFVYQISFIEFLSDRHISFAFLNLFLLLQQFY